MVLGGHLLLMMQCIHLLLMMLSGHLLLMMLSIHLLLMIHRMLPMNRAFVLDSFVVRPGLVSLNVVIVAVKIFSSCVFHVLLGRRLLGGLPRRHSRSLHVLSFSRLSPLPLLPLPCQPRLPARLCLGQRLRFC